jgi:hypothetical protein
MEGIAGLDAAFASMQAEFSILHARFAPAQA